MISHIENKDRYITNLELIAISKVLKVSIHWLLGEGATIRFYKKRDRPS